MNLHHLASYLLFNRKEKLHEVQIAEWEELTDFCCRAGLNNLLFFRLREDLENACPSVCRKRLESLFDLSFARFSRIKAEADELREYLKKSGIEAGFIKGFPLASKYYPHPACRPMQDVDCIARDEDLPAISAFLLQKGYSRLPDQSLLEKKPVFIKLLGPHVFSFEFHNKLHTSYSRGREGEWSLDPQGIPVSEDLFLSVLLHEKYFENSLRHYIDLGMILLKNNLQWGKIYDYAEKEKLLRHSLVQKKIFNDLFPGNNLWHSSPAVKNSSLTLRDKLIFRLRNNSAKHPSPPRSRRTKILDALIHFLVYDDLYFAIHTWLNKYCRFVRMKKYSRWMAGKFS